MLPFQNAHTLTNSQLQNYMLQMSQLSQLSQLSNQLGSSQIFNPLLMNQYLLSQQIQAMLMMPQMQQPTIPQVGNNTSNLNLSIDYQVKQEELMDSPTTKIQSQYCEDNQKILDIELITHELKTLIRYLSQTDNPSQKYILENFKTLPKISESLIPIIMERHMSQKKTKEEQIKFVLRKCFKFLKNKLEINQIIITPLEMEKRFYKEYFDGEEEMIPFREKSNMKTMNSQYLKKIFQSRKYVAGFKEYLENFDKIWNEENEEKVDNMVKQVLKLIQQKKIEKLCTYRRIPWVVSIRENCKQLGLAMLQYAPDQEITSKLIKSNDQELKNTIQDVDQIQNLIDQ